LPYVTQATTGWTYSTMSPVRCCPPIRTCPDFGNS
jgi:hypothetical protein